MISVPFIYNCNAVAVVLRVTEGTLDGLITACNLAFSNVGFTRAAAWSKVLTIVDFVAAWEVRVARHFPNRLYTLVLVPWLGVVPEIKAHACQVRYIGSNRKLGLFDDYVFLQLYARCW